VTVVQFVVFVSICVAARHSSFAADRGSKQKYLSFSVPEIVAALDFRHISKAYFPLRNCLFVMDFFISDFFLGLNYS